MKIQIINPIEYPGWDELLLTNPNVNFFQTTAWAKVLNESYNYIPLYFTIIENGKLSALIPLMEIKSFLTGKRGVSLPFTDECPPLVTDNKQFNNFLKSVSSYGKQAGWKHIEFRGRGSDVFGQAEAHETHFTHTLELDVDTKKIFSTFKSNVKRNIKKAQKEPVKVILSNTWDTMHDFSRLNCMTRKQHGLPPQPLSFFKKIYDHIIAPQKGFITMALYHNKPIAGAVYLHHAGNAIYKYGASDQSYLKLRPNNLIMWEAIQYYCRKGFKSFSFGRTEPENKGLLQFKRGWGTKEEKLNYYKYDLGKDCFVSKEAGLRTSYNIFRHMPLPLLRLTGSILYRHVG